MNAGKYLLEILGYYKYKVDNNLCTMDEIESAKKAIEQNMEVSGTISNFAEFFSVSEGSVRANICRKMFAKPKRKLLYPFHKFLKAVPYKWLEKK